MSWNLHFLGTGDSTALGELGSSAAVLERDGRPRLLIDCGPDVPERYRARYGEPPAALYITHTHLDHVGGLERLFGMLRFDSRGPQRPTRLFVHAAVVPLLHGRVGDHPGVVAEGGTNFWDVFHLLPCTRGFWLEGLWFALFATRHHVPGSSWGLHLPGSLVFTGDTRPVPEALAALADDVALVAHDCGLEPNPSHTGLADLAREYPPALRQRFVLYHYASTAAGAEMARAGWRVARPGTDFALPEPLPVAAAAG